MGILLNINGHFEEASKVKKMLPLLCILFLGCIVCLLFLSSSIDNKTIKYNNGNITHRLFLKKATQSGINAFIVFILIIAKKNLANQIFTKKYLHYLLFIAIIDSLVYLFLNRLITIYTRTFVITEYFISPIYLIYLILYYFIFKKVTFSLKQIIISYMFFLIGIIFTIFGLINYFCITEMRGNSHYTENYCKDEEKENKGYINYFIHSYISIIIAILLMPFLYFLRMFFSKKYMEATNNNVLIFNCKIYFFEFFIYL